MNRSTYDERDYTFGQAMLTLRTNIGLTQSELADLLGVYRRSVGEQEWHGVPMDDGWPVVGGMISSVFGTRPRGLVLKRYRKAMRYYGE